MLGTSIMQVYDLFYNELKVGDKVLFVSPLTSVLEPGRILKINLVQIIIKPIRSQSAKQLVIRTDRKAARSDDNQLIVTTRVIKHANQLD